MCEQNLLQEVKDIWAWFRGLARHQTDLRLERWGLRWGEPLGILDEVADLKKWLLTGPSGGALDSGPGQAREGLKLDRLPY
jgi:hypothetical protein